MRFHVISIISKHSAVVLSTHARRKQQHQNIIGKQLQLPPVMVDREERLALTQMANKDMDQALLLLNGADQGIEEHVAAHQNQIQSNAKGERGVGAE